MGIRIKILELMKVERAKMFLIDKMNQTLQVMKQSANLGLEKRSQVCKWGLLVGMYKLNKYSQSQKH